VSVAPGKQAHLSTTTSKEGSVFQRLMRFLLVSIVVGSALVAATGASAWPGGEVVAQGLSNPRGIAVAADGDILVAETAAGDASSPGAITRIGGASVPVPWAVDVAVAKDGATYVVTGGAEAPGEGGASESASTSAAATPSPTAHPASLLRLLPNGTTSVVADIGAYQKTDPDPYDLDKPANPTESNPNGLALLADGSVLVVDAANDDLLRVAADGKIATVARFKPETVKVPADIPNGPKAGDTVPAESVPTAVSVGPDGAYYVSELKGFPFAPGTSRIWRIAPGSTNALCDPAATAGAGAACTTYATGFTSVIDLAWGSSGTLYVLEIARKGVGALEAPSGGDPTGALFAVRDGHAVELAPGALTAPGGVALGADGRLLVTTGTVLGPKAGSVVSLDG
jgi:sugar lactone lactonase YvrE